MLKYFLVLNLLFISYFSTAQEDLHIAFYNVENLFDIENDPLTLDDEYTPTSEKEWTAKRYQNKLDHLSKVLNGIGNIQFLGLAEVENRSVVEDLLKMPPFGKQYKVAHFNSPDRRGIDVAFAYNSNLFTVKTVDTIAIQFPAKIVEDYTTRHILYVHGILKNGETLHFFINHWPSRRGGTEKSQPKRLWVADQLKKAVTNIFNQDSEANIIIMGDFNDEPSNLSLSSILGALPVHKAQQFSGFLYNLYDQHDAENKGSYRYKGDWNMLDQIIVSGALLNRNNEKVGISDPIIFQQEWMMYKNSKHGLTPSRTYGGKRHFGGYSDHLPIFVNLTLK